MLPLINDVRCRIILRFMFMKSRQYDGHSSYLGAKNKRTWGGSLKNRCFLNYVFRPQLLKNDKRRSFSEANFTVAYIQNKV